MVHAMQWLATIENQCHPVRLVKGLIWPTQLPDSCHESDKVCQIHSSAFSGIFCLFLWHSSNSQISEETGDVLNKSPIKAPANKNYPVFWFSEKANHFNKNLRIFLLTDDLPFLLIKRNTGSSLCIKRSFLVIRREN